MITEINNIDQVNIGLIFNLSIAAFI